MAQLEQSEAIPKYNLILSNQPYVPETCTRLPREQGRDQRKHGQMDGKRVADEGIIRCALSKETNK